MRPPRSSRKPFPLRGLVALGSALAGAAAMALGACLVTPPPDLPPPPAHRPTILHDAVFPPTDRILTELPLSGFVVPVVLEGQNQPYCYAVLIDFDPYNNN